jgi:hypothetical protein
MHLLRLLRKCSRNLMLEKGLNYFVEFSFGEISCAFQEFPSEEHRPKPLKCHVRNHSFGTIPTRHAWYVDWHGRKV